MRRAADGDFVSSSSCFQSSTSFFYHSVLETKCTTVITPLRSLKLSLLLFSIKEMKREEQEGCWGGGGCGGFRSPQALEQNV